MNWFGSTSSTEDSVFDLGFLCLKSWTDTKERVIIRTVEIKRRVIIDMLVVVIELVSFIVINPLLDVNGVSVFDVVRGDVTGDVPILNSDIIIGSVFRSPWQSFNDFHNSYIIYHLLIIYDIITVSIISTVSINKILKQYQWYWCKLPISGTIYRAYIKNFEKLWWNHGLWASHFCLLFHSHGNFSICNLSRAGFFMRYIRYTINYAPWVMVHNLFIICFLIRMWENNTSLA